MNETQALLQEAVARLFSDTVTKELITAVENGTWPERLWKTVEQNGLTRPHVAEEAGGAGGGWGEAFLIARASGRYSVPLPLGEALLGSWLLADAGLTIPAGPLTVVSRSADGRTTPAPWGRFCKHAVVVDEKGDTSHVSLYELDGSPAEKGLNLAREPRDEIRLPERAAAGPVATKRPAGIVTLYGALVRAGQMAGALDAVLEMSVQYAGERIQFGRPIGAFQAIQQELARLAGLTMETATAAAVAFRAAAEAAADFRGGAGEPGDPTFEIAAAKVIAGEAAETGPRIAHQVHGAIGFTYEHALHFATRRLWSWRAEYGTAGHWANVLGSAACARGADALWPLVTSR